MEPIAPFKGNKKAVYLGKELAEDVQNHAGEMSPSPGLDDGQMIRSRMLEDADAERVQVHCSIPTQRDGDISGIPFSPCTAQSTHSSCPVFHASPLYHPSLALSPLSPIFYAEAQSILILRRRTGRDVTLQTASHCARCVIA